MNDGHDGGSGEQGGFGDWGFTGYDVVEDGNALVPPGFVQGEIEMHDSQPAPVRTPFHGVLDMPAHGVVLAGCRLLYYWDV